MIKRNTIQRSLVLGAVRQLRSHATADEIYQFIIQEHPNISRGTVYRNLRQLAENGDIRPLEIPGQAERFDHECSPHYHARCTICGRVFDVDMDYLPDLTDKIKNTHGFRFTGHDIMFQGVCPDCGEKAVPPEHSS